MKPPASYQERLALEAITSGLKMQLRRLERIGTHPEVCELIKQAIEKLK